MNVKAIVLLSACVVLVFAASGAMASPTVYGQSGLVVMPAADVLGEGNFTTGISLQENNTRVHGSFGILDPVEAGFTYFTDKARFEPHAKLRVLEESDQIPALAFGFQRRDIYIVASKRLGNPQLRGHAGLGDGRYGGMLGLSYLLNPVRLDAPDMPAVVLLGELVDFNVNLGVKMFFEPMVEVSLSVLDVSSPRLALGASLVHEF